METKSKFEKKNIFTSEFQKIDINNVINEINQNGYFAIENALTNEALIKIEKESTETKLNINQKKIKIPICCDNEFGLDFKKLSDKTKLSKEKILDLYLNKEYFCYMTGFIAGMPFLGDINENIRCNRLETPRVKVPKGSVGIAEQFANIYTFESPGGWNIIGKTPLKIFDQSNLDEPVLIKVGDEVNFYQISKEEYINWDE